MNSDKPQTGLLWRARCHDALDLMRDDPEGARRAGQELIDQARAEGAALARLGGELILAFGDYYQGRINKAEFEFERLQGHFDAVNDQRSLTLCLYGRLVILRGRGRTREAYEFGHIRLLPMLPPEPTREAMVVLNGMGVVAQEYGRTEEAIRHFYSALDAARTLALPNRVAQITANIGEIFYVSGIVEDAEEMLTEARQLAQQSSERWLAPFVSTVLALSKLSMEKYEEAYEVIAEYLHEGDDRGDNQEPISNVANRVFFLSVAAYTLSMREQLDEAERLCDSATALLDKFEDKQLKPYGWWVRGHLHHQRGRNEEAVADLNRAVEEIGNSGYVFMALRAIHELTEIYAEQDDWEAAYREQRRYHTLFAHTQEHATQIRLQTLRIQGELREAELARRYTAQSIAERKRLEEDLKRSLAERDSILENSLVGIALLKADGRIHWGNRAMIQMFGVDETSYVGKSLEPHYPSREEYLKTGAAVNAAVLQGLPFETELCMRREDGTLFWAALSGRSVNRRDLSHGTVWAVMDITKRRQLEEDLSKSEEHHRQVVNNVTECIFVVQGGHIVFANPRLFELTGFSQERLFSLPFVTAIHPDDRALVIDHHGRRLRGEPVEQYYQFRIINNQTGNVVWVELSAVMIEWEGKPATLSFMTNVTERKRLEESLKKSLEERMRLQTLQIQNELKEAELARRHAEETTRAKSMFLANMSHEIRTPMNAIIGMAHLALRTELDNKQRDYVEKIHGAGISLLGLINDILDFSKIEAGKLDMEKIEFNLDQVLDNVATLTSAKAHEKGLEYLLQVPPDIPRDLIGDPMRLGQVLTNLINNAAKFTEKGEIYVACKKCEIVDGNVKLEFVVRDTGIGMHPEQAGKLFRAFSQADESTTRKYGGTGLGLSISKAMVELMGGAIWLESTLHVGTTLHFTAWFGVNEAPQQHRPVVPQAINGMRILVVDDNAVAREILAESLSTLPVEVELVVDGEQALAAIRNCDEERPYGLVFTDLRMPGMDGIELISRIKRDATLLSPPRVVLVSAYGREEVRYREQGALADGFLLKPVSASQLVDTIVGLFTPTGTRRPSAHTLAIPRFRDLSVLLVEDNEINQQIARELMEAAGITVQVAGNGRIGVDTLLAAGPGHFGLVLMDVQMPEMDGHEAAVRIRADARFAGLPMVAMTAHAMVEERARCIASGMDDHLAKPVNPAELFQTISRWCPTHVFSGLPAPEPAQQEAEPELLIEGFDVQDGLARTLGNRAFYLQMLARFRDGQRDTVAHMRAAIDQDSSESRHQAERMAHTLKGVAGQLGARAMQNLAGQLEENLRRGASDETLLPLLDRLEHDMLGLQAALASALSDKTNPEPVAPNRAAEIERTTAHALIQRFAQLLAEYDAEAIDLLTESNIMLATVLGSEAHKRVARAARRFDYDVALAALNDGARAAGYAI